MTRSGHLEQNILDLHEPSGEQTFPRFFGLGLRESWYSKQQGEWVHFQTTTGDQFSPDGDELLVRDHIRE